jgi:hypothetical protein
VVWNVTAAKRYRVGWTAGSSLAMRCRSRRNSYLRFVAHARLACNLLPRRFLRHGRGPAPFDSGNPDALDRVLHLPLARSTVRWPTAAVALQTHALASGCVAWRHLCRGVARAAHVPGVGGGTAIAWCAGTGRKRARAAVSWVSLTVRTFIGGKVCRAVSPSRRVPPCDANLAAPSPGGGFFFHARPINRRCAPAASPRLRHAPWRPWHP